ncbi:hypothetical protein HNR42_002319 [Deinobacterium chartae]|uniref:Uncharacterized protein n=1 Tax=Deinobacterium chartae TaxID=521158 RepID=A0A841I1M0_9DEIO|nr:hypothetical protein [Deinobacterium chartae]MBB6098884.1 hypothetical protein [Deinobacterium chartae]
MNERLRDLLAILLLGDGAVGLLRPVKHNRLWALGPLREPCLWLARRPGLMRAVAAVEIAAGLLLLPSREKA